MLRNRKIYDKLEEEDILDSADQDELLTAFKEDITKQQKISNVFPFLLSEISL